MLRQYQKFITLPRDEKTLFLQAYFILNIAAIQVLTIPLKKILKDCKVEVSPPPLSTMSLKEISITTSIGKAITRAYRYTPLKCTCLVQAVTAKKMLQKRDISGVIYLGTTKDSEFKEKIKFHAWSQCGSRIITGKLKDEEYKVLTVFTWS